MAEPAADPPLLLFGLEFSLDTASLDALETVVRSAGHREVADWFAASEETEEVALLTTCHRVELVLVTRSRDEFERWRARLPGTAESWKVREGRSVVHHLFRVAAGRESLAVGEGEVAHQVRAAGHRVASRHPRPIVRALFSAAADAASEVSELERTPVSIAGVAAARLRSLLAGGRPHVLVVGSGTVGRQVVENLAGSARLTVVYHQRPPDGAFLRAHGARAVPLERWTEELALSDAVVTAAKFGNHGLTAADLPRDRSLVLVDLGMPRNIDPDVRALPGVRLIDLEELHAHPHRRAGPDDEIQQRARRCAERLDASLAEPWVDDFRRAAEEIRRSELATARSFLGPLDPEQERAVERLTQRLVARLLRAPTERIRSLPAGPEGAAQRRWAAELLRPSPDGP